MNNRPNFFDDPLFMKLYNDDYVIVGSAAAICHGYEHSNNDVDIMMDPKVIIQLIMEGHLKFVNEDGKIKVKSQSEKIDCGLAHHMISEDEFTSWAVDGENFFTIVKGVRKCFRILQKPALLSFYLDLYDRSRKEKHRNVLLWMLGQEEFCCHKFS